MLEIKLSNDYLIHTNDILNWTDIVIVKDAIKDYQDGHVDIEEHHREHCVELSIMQHIVASRKNNDSTTGVEQNFQQKNHCKF